MSANNPRIREAVAALRHGEVIAYPTEAVWGLGADPFNDEAVNKILTLKNRPPEKGLILICGDITQLDFLLKGISATDMGCLKASWPGHTTWLVPHENRVPKYISGSFDKVAVRVSAHPVVKALCTKFSGPIVSTSANPQGYNPARNGCKARQYFRKRGVIFAPGIIGNEGKPSTIVDLSSKRVLR